VTSSDRTRYEALAPFAGVYLEDSYVFGIESTHDRIVFDLDLVLTPEHPAYREPPETEQYCFRRARAVIDGADSVCWGRRSMRAIQDASGEVDYGSIDSWYAENGVTYVEGEWGEVEIRGGTLRLDLD
jgi:hypothetical protein